MGASPMHLPWTTVMRWASAHRYSEAETMFLDACICAMDDQFMDIHNEQERLRRAAKPQ
ncbi:hypothetical protein [Sediminicoccus sp. KRV36]|uniref:hypothetical protein n=1 Tax=Sediminicoccus sp. KRV36 TaxID=3133721 RepID=UPI00200EB06C|nr:hypothetical protein [Sediminicoccus rosea]UPY35495.1 hypothetical protein LHU95_14850 [Sediminicoccus rosea]